jgi:hypothetical protein
MDANPTCKSVNGLVVGAISLKALVPENKPPAPATLSSMVAINATNTIAIRIPEKPRCDRILVLCSKLKKKPQNRQTLGDKTLDHQPIPGPERTGMYHQTQNLQSSSIKML